ncbi:hypothetical protein [Desulfocurvus sp.]|uniref:hypothetical protein n=1 Tax=Desulfocurvus sp. TaxID=2871698 RepID=UPI0025BB9EAD|nr:hypothetical protein [Desulfocurvus sp.]MCK9241001.1 hypothetical protein [Desulfocurvus sp.]
MNEDTPTAPEAMTLDEALALLGVDALPGLDGDGESEFLEGMARMRRDEGEDWIRDNREDLLALWAALLAVPVADEEPLP